MQPVRSFRSLPRAMAHAVLVVGLLLSVSGCATMEDPDPLEPMNRKIFAFNETLDKYALEPVARGWDYVLPGFVQTGINNFFTNLDMPKVFANNVLQGKPMAAFEDVLRLLYNSTFGLAGFIDVASMVGIPKHDEDFGQTLGVWGVPSGPFLVVPILGPYTFRSGAGEIADTLAASYAYYNRFWFDVVGLNTLETAGATVGVRALELLNLRAIYLEEIEGSRRDAFDYYAFIRSAYLQNRRAKVLDQKDEAVIDADELYYFDDEEEEDYDDFNVSDEVEADAAVGDSAPAESLVEEGIEDESR